MSNSKNQQKKCRIQFLHQFHPNIRAADWRSPLVRRLTDDDIYEDGNRKFDNSFRPPSMSLEENEIALSWAGLKDDYDKCLKTYQAPVITEYATLGLACILLTYNANLEITEVTRRGDKADFWIGDKELLIEISGQQRGNLDELCKEKSVQLLANPFKRPGYICVANYELARARLWYLTFNEL